MIRKLVSFILLIALIQVIFFAKSGSALLALILGFLIYIMIHKKRVFLFTLLSCFVIILFSNQIISLLEEYVSKDSSRILYLGFSIISNPFDFILIDSSLNARIGGAFATFTFIFIYWHKSLR